MQFKRIRVYIACSQSVALLAMYFRIIWVKKMFGQEYLLRDFVINSESDFINTPQNESTGKTKTLPNSF